MLTRGRVHPRWPSLAESAFPAVRSAARRRRWAGSASPSSAARNGAWHTAQVHEMFVEVMAKKKRCGRASDSGDPLRVRFRLEHESVSEINPRFL